MKPAEEYILSLPENYKNMILHVIAVVEQILPETELLFKWRIPYIYYKKKPFCYLYANQKKEFVDIGFAKGFQLQHNQEFLVGEKRNTVKSLRYFSLNEINNDVLIAVVKEAKTLYK